MILELDTNDTVKSRNKSKAETILGACTLVFIHEIKDKLAHHHRHHHQIQR